MENNIIFTGTRDKKNAERYRDKIKEILENLILEKSNINILHGGCTGVDKIVDDEANKLGLNVIVYPADWKKYGKFAGPMRNKEMLETKAIEIYAFHQDIKNSKGTKNIMEQAKKYNIKRYLYE